MICLTLRVMHTAEALSQCANVSNKGVLLWIAGQRLNPAISNTTFVWKVTTHNSTCFTLYPMTYSNWNEDEPSNAGGNEACLNILPQLQYSWSDAPCSWETCFVCEIEAYQQSTSVTSTTSETMRWNYNDVWSELCNFLHCQKTRLPNIRFWFTLNFKFIFNSI